MERGPMALFAAIIAVGLGPALWLGAQFGQIPPGPAVPTTAIVKDQAERVSGGGAAADENTGPTANDFGDVTRRVAGEPSLRPQRATPSPVPSPTGTTPPVSASPSPSETGANPTDEGTEQPSPDPTGSVDATPAGPAPSGPGTDSSPQVQQDAGPGILVQVGDPATS